MDKFIEKDLKYNWHPYTQMKDHEDFPPILIEKAKGIKLYDNKGKWYYDTISSWWCNIHGHNHPKIVKAINNQLKKLDHVLFAGFTHKGAIELSEKLVSLMPKNLTRVFYSDDGSTSVETALKMSLQYWTNTGVKGKTKFISLDRGYHGDTFGAMSLGGVELFNEMFSELFFDSYRVASPYCYRCPMGKERKSCSIDCIKSLEELLKKKSENISAFIIEPMVLAAGGMIIYPKEYLKKAFDLCKKYNVHFIADEVAVGFGRTGKMFAFEHAGIKPDFVCLSKGLTSGTMPFAATLTTEEIYKTFYGELKENKTLYHGHTFTANPIGCAVALASLDIFKKGKVLQKVQRSSKVLQKGLEKFKKFQFVGDIRSIGMIGAMELVKNTVTKEAFPYEKRLGYLIYKEGLKNNVILRPMGNIIYFYLPLCTTEKEIKDILKRAYKTFEKIFNK